MKSRDFKKLMRLLQIEKTGIITTFSNGLIENLIEKLL